MSINIQIEIVLFIVIIILVSLLFYSIKYIREIKGIDVGIPEGQIIPNVDVNQLNGVKDSFHNFLVNNTSMLICMVSPTCPSCNDILEFLNSLSTDVQSRIILVSNTPIDKIKDWIKNVNSPLNTLILDEEDAYKKMRLTKAPFGILVKSDGEVIKKGSINKFIIGKWLEI